MRAGRPAVPVKRSSWITVDRYFDENDGHLDLGRRGEELAAAYLEQAGIRLWQLTLSSQSDETELELLSMSK